MASTMTSTRRHTFLGAGLPIGAVSEKTELVFPDAADLNRAWELGFFYLKAPEHLDLDSARQFGRELIDDSSVYRRIPKYGELEGFIALENNQQTKLALRRERWDLHYPAHIAAFGRELDELGVAIMREVLRQSRIPEPLWDRASGGYASGGGDAFLNFVHYDTHTPDLGLRPHTDYGFVTILDASAPGLQIEIDGEFEDVPVLQGHFIINFGEALNFITAYSDRAVTAVRHRVLSQRATNPVRHGIVYFANPDLDGMLLQFDTSGSARGSSSVGHFFARLERDLTTYQ